ncbi:transporter substrate-binding domain-containing protein [Lysinibacillus sp. HST-98]|mgnify:CR=1 FL=1|uniref:Arginine ABC transporter arginine-binding protein ArtP n=1 Tax=Lysinibacillus capsici TaxID=2115968 RepID=A0A2X1A625_9BACI|nr:MULTISPECIES: transporter substrate-binding domain-containing protein [Lysinibacillus]EFI67949.1 histidine-binding protein precursor [Lysinibacillus fusiformis ZC1]EKU43055.1 histidine-binding protein precursor [Lysinibacillus fusiformis ZB2]WHP42845.1 transporter substrate-binding domain-containing protein [Lysinibacillus boronitolerans]AUS86798.1 ABC transporter substrate-binding protein [Lysinibacillus sp. YS11]KMN39664.1 ABC transporter substrate-binding protein [Lysinibacillus sp. LK3]
MKRKWLLVMISIMTAIVLAACGTSDKKEGGSSDAGTDKEEGGGEFRIGMEAGYPPFNWTQQDDANGAVKIADNAEYAGGYDVQMAKKIAEGLGKELVIVKMEWDGLVPALQSNKIDAIIAGMSPTEERKKTIDFTENYYTSDFVMVIKKGSKYEGAKSIQDFSGAKITSQLNTSNYTVIDQIKGVEKQTAMESFPAMRVALEAGKIDGYVAERPEGISASAANDKFTYVAFEEGFDTDLSNTSIAVGLRKDDANREKINEILKGISEDDRQAIMEEAISQQPAAQ